MLVSPFCALLPKCVDQSLMVHLLVPSRGQFGLTEGEVFVGCWRFQLDGFFSLTVAFSVEGRFAICWELLTTSRAASVDWRERLWVLVKVILLLDHSKAAMVILVWDFYCGAVLFLDKFFYKWFNLTFINRLLLSLWYNRHLHRFKWPVCHWRGPILRIVRG